MPNPFVYSELHTHNPTAAKEFYRKLFDWKMTDNETPFGTYTEIDAAENSPAGLMAQLPEEKAPYWLPYVLVSDLDSAAARAKSLGGTLRADKAEVPGMGWFVIVTDPQGARFALWEKIAPAPAK